jgi:probable HAF family extracellular repeat protein
MKSKNLIAILAALALIMTWSCQKDHHLVDPLGENQELLKKKPIPEPEPDITIIDLGTAGGLASVAYGVNVVDGDLWVVGYTHLPSGSGVMANAFLWKMSTGILEDIGPNLGGEWSEARDVNSDGVIVGLTLIPGVGDLAVMWLEDGTVVNLEDYVPSTCPDSRAYAVNINGVVAGSATPGADCKKHMWAWDPPATTDLGNQDLEGAYASGINTSGAIVGCVQPTISVVDLRAVWSSTGLPGDLVMLSGLENDYSEATDINDANQIVGHFNASVGHRGFLYENGSYIELPSLGGQASVYAISEEGYVTGESRLKKQGRHNPSHAYLWHQDIGIIDLGTLEGEKLSISIGYDVTEHPDEPNIMYVVGWSDNRAVLWTVDITPIL